MTRGESEGHRAAAAVGDHAGLGAEAAARVNWGEVKLPKLGWLRFRWSRDITGTPRNLTASRRAEQWFIAVQWERDVAEPAPSMLPAVGIDLGVRVGITDGERDALTALNRDFLVLEPTQVPGLMEAVVNGVQITPPTQ